MQFEPIIDGELTHIETSLCKAMKSAYASIFMLAQSLVDRGLLPKEELEALHRVADPEVAEIAEVEVHPFIAHSCDSADEVLRDLLKPSEQVLVV